MNYRDYIKIMTEEQLEESEAVKMALDRAKKIQKNLKSLYLYLEESLAKGSIVILKGIEQFEKDKDDYIEFAISVARLEKMLGWKILESGDDAILALYELKRKEPCEFYDRILRIVERVSQLKIEEMERKAA